MSAWITNILVSAILCVMTIGKVMYNSMQISGRWKLSSLVESITPLFTALVRDGTVHFMLISAVVCINTILVCGFTGPIQTLGADWLIATYSWSGSRLILKLRETARSTGHTTQNEFELETLHGSVGTARTVNLNVKFRLANKSESTGFDSAASTRASRV